MPTPDVFGLAYEDLELVAQDGVKLRCYLLKQAKDLPQPEATKLAVPGAETDDEVRPPPPFLVHTISRRGLMTEDSMLRRGRR